MTTPIPDFNTAVERFRNFVGQVGHQPSALVWIFREDATTNRRRILVRVTLPADNEHVARTRFEQGRALGIGVCLDVFCRLGPVLCCSTWFVEDMEESARRMCGGLKLSVPFPNHMPVASPLRSLLIWKLRSWLDSRAEFNQFKNFVPLRHVPGSA